MVKYFNQILSEVIFMWASGAWRDYELIDCGGGERLERWASYYTVRPDPQAIWARHSGHPKWETPDGRYLRSASGGGRWEKAGLPAVWEIKYGDLRFKIKPMSFKHTGIFPEQAANWDWTAELIKNAGRKVSVLNLFAYTGGATIAAAMAGASVCHVDAAKGMVAWGRENAEVSGLGSASIRWIVDDCRVFIERELRRGRSYDAIVMDPPSYGRGPSGETWKIGESLDEFVRLAVKLLSDDPLFVLLNSYTAGLSPSTAGYILENALDRRGITECDELGLPCAASGLTLPCGASARWSANGK